MTVDAAQKFDTTAKLGELVETEQLDGDVFGRIGAQTAKQIVLQRIREVERDQVFDQFASREGELITGTVNRVEPRAIILDVGKNVEAILATTEQSPLEHYRIGQNVKAFVLEVRRSVRGPQIFVSRTHKGFLRRLFELEVPEIHNGTVEIKAIAREAGSRSKVAVSSRQDGPRPGRRDRRPARRTRPGGRGRARAARRSTSSRGATTPAVFVANALSPAQVLSVDIDEEHRIASVTVPERMLSLAIGREGQNARLAARLTGWRIDIRSDVSVAEAKARGGDPRGRSRRGDRGRRDRWNGCRGRAADQRRSRSAASKAVAAAAVAAGAESVTADDTAEAAPVEAAADAPAKPKRATKAAAATADAEAAPKTKAAPKAKPASKAKAAPKGAATADAADDASTEAAASAKPKRATQKAVAAEAAAEEVAS